MKMKMLFSSLAIAAIVGCALAQEGQGGPPPGGPPPGGFGGGQGRFGGPPGMGGPRGGGLMPEEMLVQRPDVQTEIKLTDDQKTQLQQLQQSMRSKMQAQFQQGGGPGQDDGDREARQKAMEEMRKSNRDAMDKILSDDQKKRVKEIAVQLAGNRAILDKGIQKDLGMTDDQTSKIKSIMDQSRAANNAIREKMQNQEIDPDSARQSMQKNQKVLESALGSILTSDQSAKLKEMGGKHFEATSQGFGPGGPGGFGGPGGPGGFGGPGGGPGGPGGPPPGGGPGGGPGEGGPPPPGDGE